MNFLTNVFNSIDQDSIVREDAHCIVFNIYKDDGVHKGKLRRRLDDFRCKIELTVDGFCLWDDEADDASINFWTKVSRIALDREIANHDSRKQAVLDLFK